MKKLPLILSLAALAVGSSSALAAPPAPSDVNAGDRALVCHVTGSATNPVVYIYVPGKAQPPRQACAPKGDEESGDYGF